MEVEVAEVVAEWMRSPEHRRILLDSADTVVNVGIAHDRFNLSTVQHFTSDYVQYDQKPAIDSDGTLRLRGAVVGATLDIGEVVNVQIAYGPPPRYLTTGQLTHTNDLCNPVVVAYLTKSERQPESSAVEPSLLVGVATPVYHTLPARHIPPHHERRFHKSLKLSFRIISMPFRTQ